MTLTEFIHSCRSLFCPEQKGLLAVSGGVDSSVLCHLMHEAGFPFAIAHCNFHLRPGECDRDERFVCQLAERYGADLYLARFDTEGYASRQGLSIEEAARDLRYQFFQEVLDGKHAPEYVHGQASSEALAYIATAHHRDDATETFFINLLRGTGISGLHGIRSKNGKIVRPLLPFGRDEIEAYAQANGLSHVEDCTNATTAYRRNQIRLRVMPLLRDIAPNIDVTMQQNISRLSEVEQIYSQSIASYRSRLVRPQGEEVVLAVCDVRALVPQRTILYELLRPYGFSSSTVEEILAHVNNLEAQTGAQFFSPTHRLMHDRDSLVVSRRSDPSTAVVPLERKNLVEPHVVVSLASQHVRVDVCHSVDFSTLTPCEACFDMDRLRWPLSFRHWQEGDRFRPFGMKGTQLVSDYFSDHKFSLLQKEQTWLLCDADNTILWIVGHRAAHHCEVASHTRQILKLTIVRGE